MARLKTLDQQLDDAEALKQFAQQLLEIHQLVLQAPNQFLLVGETEQLDRYRDELLSPWPTAAGAENFASFTLQPVSAQVRAAGVTNTPVNFCAKAYPTVPSEHPDAAALTALGGAVRTGTRH